MKRVVDHLYNFTNLSSILPKQWIPFGVPVSFGNCFLPLPFHLAGVILDK